MSIPRTTAKPIQAQLEIIFFKSAIFGLALTSLPSLPRFLKGFLSEPYAEYAITIASRALKFGLFVSVARHLNKIASHVSVNSWKSSPLQPANEIVVVTGGSSGIGALVVRGFAERGAKVINLDLNESKEPSGPNIFFYKTDVTSSASIDQAATSIRASHGEPTVLINNAGVGFGETILEASEAHIRTVLNVNLLSHFLTVKEFLPSMIQKNHGHVVSVASMASFVTIAQNVDYSCTKAAVLAFHEGLRQELKHRYNAKNVRTSIIHPWWVRTPLTAPLEKSSKNFPQKILEPETVADAIIEQVVSGHGDQIILPKKMAAASLVRGLPTWLQERLRNKEQKTVV